MRCFMIRSDVYMCLININEIPVFDAVLESTCTRLS